MVNVGGPGSPVQPRAPARRRAKSDSIEIVANTLASSADMKALIRAIELCREIGNSSVMSRFAKREVMPGNLTAGELESFARNAVSAFWHQACTAKMGRDEMSVVDGQLRMPGRGGGAACRNSIPNSFK
jgi:choline dehydrogenase